MRVHCNCPQQYFLLVSVANVGKWSVFLLHCFIFQGIGITLMSLISAKEYSIRESEDSSIHYYEQ